MMISDTSGAVLRRTRWTMAIGAAAAAIGVGGLLGDEHEVAVVFYLAAIALGAIALITAGALVVDRPPDGIFEALGPRMTAIADELGRSLDFLYEDSATDEGLAMGDVYRQGRSVDRWLVNLGQAALEDARTEGAASGANRAAYERLMLVTERADLALKLGDPEHPDDT